MAKKKTTEKMTTYILTMLGGGLRKVTVPSAYKVTFGPLVMPKKGDGGGYAENNSRTLCLRFYEGTTQRAVFTDVRSFRDQSIPIEERITRTKTQVVAKHAPTGRRNVEVQASVSEWVNPDEPQESSAADNSFLQIEGIADE